MFGGCVCCFSWLAWCFGPAGCKFGGACIGYSVWLGFCLVVGCVWDCVLVVVLIWLLCVNLVVVFFCLL